MPSFLFVGKESFFCGKIVQRCFRHGGASRLEIHSRQPSFFKTFQVHFFFSMVKKHARLAVRLKRHYKNNFCSFYPFELKVCRMVELCIRNNRVIFVFQF